MEFMSKLSVAEDSLDETDCTTHCKAWINLAAFNPFVAVGWFINHYFFVKFFFLEEKIIPKIFQTFGWCIYPVSVTLWAPWLGDFENLDVFYRKIKIEKMPKIETLLATRGLIWSV